jgi:signal transduction histidine kinase
VVIEFLGSAEPRPALSRRAFAFDVGLAAVAVVASVVNAGSIDRGPSALMTLGVALTAAPIAFRRRYPVIAFWTMLAFIFPTSNYATTTTFVVVLFAAYCAVVYSRYRHLALLNILVAGLLITAVFSDTAPNLPGRFSVLFALIPVAAVGNAIRLWHRRAGDSAERLRRAEAEHSAATARAVAAERARIASELHDVVTHNVSVMVVQAGAARQVLADSPDDAREALLAVEASGRTAMTELRHLLGLLAPQGDELLRPQPGLGQLPSLMSRVRAAGLAVELAVEGEERPLPPGLDLAAYRVIQEGLTNVIRHAGQSRAEVRLDYRADELLIDIADNGSPAGHGGAAGFTGPGTGHGLIGLRERVALYGGDLDAGPRPGGGWRVRAVIPLAGQQPPVATVPAGVPVATVPAGVPTGTVPAGVPTATVPAGVPTAAW